jgi:hypothetical protein
MKSVFAVVYASQSCSNFFTRLRFRRKERRLKAPEGGAGSASCAIRASGRYPDELYGLPRGAPPKTYTHAVPPDAVGTSIRV